MVVDTSRVECDTIYKLLNDLKNDNPLSTPVQKFRYYAEKFCNSYFVDNYIVEQFGPQVKAKTKKVELFIYDQGGIDCQEDECKHAFQCANHRTAGDYRSTGGFTPKLTIEDRKNHCYGECESFYEEKENEEVRYDEWPKNHSVCGALFFDPSGKIHVLEDC